MNVAINLVQGTPEWITWRNSGIGASDAPVIEELSPYRTRRELFFEKTGKLIEKGDPSKEFIFAKGHRVEGMIRKEFQELVKTEITPICLVHPQFEYLRASLDGFSVKHGVLEAKLVGQETLSEARDGNLPSHHYSQMQHQFAVSGADVGQWFGHDGKKNGVLLEVKANKDYISKLLEQEHQFWNDVKSGNCPPLSVRDYLFPEDDKMLAELRDAKELSENAEIAYKALLAKVTAHYNHPKIAGAGIKLFKVTRKGSLNPMNIPEVEEAVEITQRGLKPDYIEKFRGKPSESWTLKFDGGTSDE